VDFSSVLFTDTEGLMLPVSAARARLAETEPLLGVPFTTRELGTEVVIGKGWFEREPVQHAPVWLTLPGGYTAQLTRQATDQLASLCKANKKFQEFIPTGILEAIVNYGLREGLQKKNGDGLDLQLLVSGMGTGLARNDGLAPDEVPLAVAATRATVQPFSNLSLLDAVLLSARAKFGHAVAERALVDYKFFNDLEHTSFRVIFPDVQQVVASAADAWCYGVEVSNSAIGSYQTEVAGYLFRFSTTGGITDLESQAGGFQRRDSTPEQAYAWAAEACGEIFDHAEDAFDGVRTLQDSDVDDDLGTVMPQLYRDSPVSKELKLRISEELANCDERVTMLHVADAASVAANDPEASWRDVRSLLDLAGTVLHQGGGMCRGQLAGGCRRLLQPGYGTAA
jgi:hypothetical protein